MHAGTQNRKARIIVFALVLCSVVVLALPLGSASADSNCHLDCCAARAAHPAGSCLGGTCHAVIKDARHAHASRTSFVPREKLCGVTQRPLASAKLRLAARSVLQKNVPGAERRLDASGNSLAQPCPAECCGGNSAFGGARHQRSVGRINSAPTPPAEIDFDLAVCLVKTRAGSHLLFVPRGPPSMLA